jgi:hypothetical protein
MKLLMEIDQDHARKGVLLDLSLSIRGLGEVRCMHVLRSIKGKRVVCTGDARGARVIVKLFFAGRGAYGQWRRNDRGCRAFLDRGIPAPGILFSGYLPDYGLYAMVLEYLEGGTRLDRELGAAGDEHRRSELLALVIRGLAGHHLAGVTQNDLHLGNFMLKDGIVHSLDGDRVRLHRRAPGRRRALDNLAGLLANIPDVRDADLDLCIRAYAGERRWSLSRIEELAVRDKAYGIRRKSLRQFLGKTLRSRDPFMVQSGPGLFAVLDRRHTDVNLLDLLNADGAAEGAQGALGASGYRVRTCRSGRLLQLTSLNFGPLALKHVFRSAGVWRKSLMLRRIGLLTPEPVALVLEKRAAFLWRGSVFFREADGTGLKDLGSSPGALRPLMDRIRTGLEDACSRMSRAGIDPTGLRPEDIMIQGGSPVFINPSALRRTILTPRTGCSEALLAFLSGLDRDAAP